MRILILSSNTPHHVYFINRIADLWNIVGVLYETEHPKFPFDAKAPYADQEAQFEQENFFKTVSYVLPATLPVHTVSTVNTPEAAEIIRFYQADIALVFGCGRIRSPVFPLFPQGLINVHRGIASEYRGLDCDLWPIYHGDFENMGVTLHYVAENLDTGDVIAEERLQYGPNYHISQIRYYTTVMATDLMLDVLQKVAQRRGARVKLEKHGRYYSAMPAPLKALCEKKFDRYIKNKFSSSAPLPL